ncbi:MAG TPA: AAA family ATPase [Solirubrobacteraceae bacterium]|nr:AAA family ATPase [Solirubrobacteraceae bacterium]
MNTAVNTLVALDGEVDRGLIETVVTRDPLIKVIDYLELEGPPSSGLGAGDVLIVAVADYTAQAQDFVATSRRQHPQRPIVLMCPPSGDGFLGDAFESGIDDVVALPTESRGAIDPMLGRQLAFALEKAVMRKRGPAELKEESDRNVICVLGLKGGSGKTLTSVNLATALAMAGHSVAIMDLDLQFGDVALAMGMNPVRTMYDLVSAGGSLDAEKLSDYLVEHPSGVRALLAPVRPDHAAVITVPFLAEVQRQLAQMFEFVVIDTPPSFSPEVIAAVDSSTDVLVVVMRDTLSLKNTKLGLETLERMEYDRGHVKVLLNRANTKVGIERDDVLAILGRDADVLLPSHVDITRSINHGEPITLHGASEAASAFHRLAQHYIAQSAGEAELMFTPRRRASDALPARQGGRGGRALFRRSPRTA